MATVSQLYGTYTTMSTVYLSALSASATVGWQSAIVSNLTNNALDYEIFVSLQPLNAAPAGAQAVYIYASLAANNGTNWYYSDGGTTTLPSGSDSSYTIASPNDLRLLGVMNYTTQNQPMQSVYNISNVAGMSMPDGFSLVIINTCGTTLVSSGNLVAYRTIQQTVA